MILKTDTMKTVTEAGSDSLLTTQKNLVLPEGIRRPLGVAETIELCKLIFSNTHRFPSDEDEDDELYDSENAGLGLEAAFPSNYKDLYAYLQTTYENQYSTGQSATFTDPYVEAVFQQFQIHFDREKGRSGVNHVGLYAPTYIDALGTAKYDVSVPYVHKGEVTGILPGTVDNRFLGRYHFAENKRFRAVLLGCSSMSSAYEFNQMAKGMNPTAEAIIIDNNPLSVALAKSAGAHALLADVLTPQSSSLEPTDLIATNFLITSLPKEKRNEAYRKLLEVWQPYLYPRTGRLVMVEQVDYEQLMKLDDYAIGLGYTYKGDSNPKTQWGRNRIPSIYSRDVDYYLSRLHEDLESDRLYQGSPYSNKVDSVVVRHANALIYAVGSVPGENVSYSY